MDDYQRLPSLEAQPTTTRREDDPQYSDDPEFKKITQSLSAQLFNLTSNIVKLSNQVALLGTKRDTERVRERVHNLLEDTRSGFKDVGEGVKKVQAWEDVSPAQKYTQQKLSREFQSALAEFQTVQRSALEKQRTSARAARTALEEQQSSGNVAASGDQTGELQEQEQLRLAPQSDVDFQDSLIIERESEIRNIEQSVGELNELFRDVAHIVGQQGTQLDMIADNVENVRTDAQGADAELRTASRYQKNARSRMCCLLLILSAIVAVILLAAFLG
ncbi:MAG: hypothetical protein M1826_006482 [Phylliscum demangeonii]|nr:MAG: hypothetical protein M1826_006482 [Phylliscum demangeonii]